MCYCGDYFCWQCGPAQGNHQCDACGQWTFDGGCDDPQTCLKVIQEVEAAIQDEWLADAF